MNHETVLLAISALVTPLQDGTTIPEPSWGRYAVPASVSYVAIMQIDVDGMETRAGQITIKQSDQWHRETTSRAGVSETSIVDLNTGRSWHYREPHLGERPSLSIGGGAGLRRTTMQRTNRVEFALGETCRVWILSTGNIVRTACLTDDGIGLWYRWSSEGRVIDSAHAVSIIRRQVTEAELAPPSWTANLQTWSMPPEAKKGRLPNDKVLLTNCPVGEDACARTMRISRLGDLTSTIEVYPNGRLEKFLSPSYALVIDRSVSGELKRLDIGPASQHDIGAPRTPATPPKENMVFAGERCLSIQASVVPDAGQWECRSRDGVLLARQTTGWGSTALVATSINRGKTILSDVLPPKEVLSSP